MIRFQPIGPADLQRIVRLQVLELAHLLQEQGLALKVDEPVVAWLAEQGYEPEYGAGPCAVSCAVRSRTPWRPSCSRSASSVRPPFRSAWARVGNRSASNPSQALNRTSVSVFVCRRVGSTRRAAR